MYRSQGTVQDVDRGVKKVSYLAVKGRVRGRESKERNLTVPHCLPAFLTRGRSVLLMLLLLLEVLLLVKHVAERVKLLGCCKREDERDQGEEMDESEHGLGDGLARANSRDSVSSLSSDYRFGERT